MKKLKLQLKQMLLILLTFIMTSCMFFTSCGEGGDSGSSNSGSSRGSTVTVTFDYNYDSKGTYEVQTIEKGDIAEEPDEPTREHYDFIDWYTDAECTTKVDFENVINKDTTFYAGWTKLEAVVTFYVNDGTSNVFLTSNATINGAVKEPETTPERSGYLFDAWYTSKVTDRDSMDAESDGIKYDFATLVNDDFSLYAGWIKDDGSNHTVTYKWNYKNENNEDAGNYRVQKVADRSYLTLPTPERGDTYKFMGWYTDAECTSTYDNSKKVRDDVTLYALWYNSVVFEAEHIDLDGIKGYGYSGNNWGTDIIYRDIDNQAGASNGFYISYLYYKDITLTFNIVADEAVSGALLYLRCSAEYYDLDINCEQLLVKVNGVAQTFNNIKISVEGAGSSGGVTSSNIEIPFADYLVGSNVALEKGENTIEIVINNWKPEGDRTGTMYSYAPVVDAIKLCSAGDVSNVHWNTDMGYPKTSNTANK